MNNITVSRRTLGVNFTDTGIAEVLLWAPRAEHVALHVEGNTDLSLSREGYGYWHTFTDVLQAGMKYQVEIDGKLFPDIYSLSQPDGVHGPSEVFRPDAHQWTDEHWKNIPLQDHILYELHTGTFSPEGTFAGIEKKLDHLLDLGITAIELMPVAQFPGERNWGYDGVFPFAVQHSYGGPAALQQLVDVCHQKGLAVVLDVVYNHVGPEGNYLSQYGPFFTKKYQTPWGDAINFDDAGCDEVRRFFIENALMWLRDIHIDALRLDAVHAIKDFSPKHILQELREKVDELMAATGRIHHLIIECDLNDKRFIEPLGDRGFGMDAQWNDEFHHALRVAAGGKKEGYYRDFERLGSLKKAYEHAYVYCGQYSVERQRSFGTDPAANPGRQFVVFSQNHDQVGNRMLGERSSQLFSFEMQKLMAAAVLVSPFLPMLFMGEEYSEPDPFLYFVSHSDPQLIAAVQKGRKQEFEAFQQQGEAPDPQSPQTFERSKLKWQTADHGQHAIMLKYYKALISLRKSHPLLKYADRTGLHVGLDKAKKLLTLQRTGNGLILHCLLNFSQQEQALPSSIGTDNCSIIFNSASSLWSGPATSSEFLTPDTTIMLHPESILILEENV